MSAAFYKLLPASKQDVPLGLTAKECQRRLARLEGDELQLAALDRDALAGALADRVRPVPAPGPAHMDDDVAGDLPLDDGEIEGVVEMGEADVAGDAVDGHEGPPVPAMPVTIAGCATRFIKGRHDDGWQYYDRWKVFCPNPEHAPCSKSRSVQLDIEALGPRACELFLHAWILRAYDQPAHEHRRYVPTVAERRAVADAA